MAAGLHSDSDDARAPAWIIVAALLHGALFAAVMLLPKPTPKMIGMVDPIEVTVVETPPSDVPAPDVPREQAAPDETHPAAVAAVTPPSGASFTTPGPATSVLTVGEAAPNSNEGVVAPAGSGPGVSLIKPEQLALGGIGANNPFLPKKEEIPPQMTNQKRREPLRGTGMERDVGLGLGPEGPAISAINESTRTSIAPLKGRAMFLVRAGSDGTVSGVEVIDSAGDSGWLDAAKQTLAALKSKKFRVPEGANGLAMRIEVVSDMKLPNGQSSPIEVRPGASKVPELIMPDVSNIGQNPRRVVSSRAVSIEVL